VQQHAICIVASPRHYFVVVVQVESKCIVIIIKLKHVFKISQCARGGWTQSHLINDDREWMSRLHHHTFWLGEREIETQLWSNLTLD
jgi:hypothetical protein